MKTLSNTLRPALYLTIAATAISAGPAAYAADIYVPIVPCRILETRNYGGFTGSGPLLPTAASPYTYGTTNASVIAQDGNPAGCGIPSGITAIGASIAMLNPTGTGDIRAWSPATSMPLTAIGLFNGSQLFNSAFSNIPVDGSGMFDVKVENGSVNLVIDVFGYWTPLPVGGANQTLRFGAANTLAANGLLQSFSDGGLLATGTFGTGSIPTTASGTRMMWYPAKAAFRVGSFNGSSADDANIGAHSVAMGTDATAMGQDSIALGPGAFASGDSSIALGYGSTAEAATAVALASGNAWGFGSFAVGSGTYAENTASMAMGVSTYSTHPYAFVYGDGLVDTFSDAPRQFMVRATGGFKFYSSTNTTAGLQLASGNSAWTTLSDRNAKDALRPVDARAVLEKVAAMPLATWHYKTQDTKYRHMGPMAQDFYAAFELGETNTGIDTVDADGVALAAIQGLNALLAEKDAKLSARLDSKEREIAALRAELDAEKSRVAALEAIADDVADVKAQLAAMRRSASVTVAMKP